MHEKSIERIRFEIGQIDRLIQEYADLLNLAKTEDNEPSLVEFTAMASVLHSFYTGLENIFISIAKGIDRDVPAGGGWHRKLLNQMKEPTPNRSPLLSDESSHQLIEYLGFRHFYRHSYSFFLEWDRLEVIVKKLPEVWEQTKGEIEHFLGSIESG